MSVIFGIKENNRIIIAGDKRGSSIDGKTLSDDLDKVLMINDHLAFSSAGNAAIEKAISIDLNKATNKDCLTTDDLLDIIKAFYKRVADTNCDAILALPFYFLIAGKGRDGNASLISGGNIKGRLDAKDVPMALFPPADAKMQECCDCFAKNYKLHNSEFVYSILYKPCIFKAYRLLNVQTLCIFPCFCPYEPKQGKFFILRRLPYPAVLRKYASLPL